jgi:hypothetical protein
MELTIERPNKKPKMLRVSQKDLDQLRRTLETNSWATLNGAGYVGSCNDCPRCSLEVKSGVTFNRIVIYQSEKPSGIAAEVRRFLSVWQAIKVLAGLSREKDACP